MSDLRDQAVEALVDPAWSHVVDLVAHPDGDGGVVVASSRGAARVAPGEPTQVLHGEDPVADQDPMAFLPYERELADPSPPNQRNAYPYAAERLLSAFADPDRSPDLVVVHTPRHFFPDRGGHAGEHGSLDVVQSRAPLLVSGPGVRSRGLLDDHARLVDVAPTLMALAGVPRPEGVAADADGRALDGTALPRLVEPAARWVVGILWDGAHCGDLLHLAEQGRLPGVARLLERGCALRGGAVAEFPSVTLTNHTSILTGVGPGRHGVLGNAYFDRATHEVVVPNDSATWHRSAEWLRPGVRTVFEQVAVARPGSPTACINEAVDRGAGWSTMGQVRASGVPGGASGLDHLLPDPAASRFLTDRAHLAEPGYSWATQVDDAGVEMLLALWQSAADAPALTWWAHVVTDAGHHAGGPRSNVARDSLRDADRRLEAFLDHLDHLGAADDVVVLLTADHGFEGADPTVRGDWDDALRAAGVPFRDVGPGFVYLGEEVAG
ncbi:MAG TPA: alkaline phosphatase family protein [Jiangellales bacterium]|nr:alkaline phosphatase family protein [Jiangellales bacterium]